MGDEVQVKVRAVGHVARTLKRSPSVTVESVVPADFETYDQCDVTLSVEEGEYDG